MLSFVRIIVTATSSSISTKCFFRGSVTICYQSPFSTRNGIFNNRYEYVVFFGIKYKSTHSKAIHGWCRCYISSRFMNKAHGLNNIDLIRLFFIHIGYNFLTNSFLRSVLNVLIIPWTKRCDFKVIFGSKNVSLTTWQFGIILWAVHNYYQQ